MKMPKGPDPGVGGFSLMSKASRKGPSSGLGPMGGPTSGMVARGDPQTLSMAPMGGLSPGMAPKNLGPPHAMSKMKKSSGSKNKKSSGMSVLSSLFGMAKSKSKKQDTEQH